jgi:hypothetical protein
VHGGTYGHLDRFQIDASGLALLVEDGAQEAVCFFGDFLLDGLRRFFLSAGTAGASSMGRNRQIFSFTSTNAWLRSRKRWCSATSFWVFRKAAGFDRDSVTLLPWTL